MLGQVQSPPKQGKLSLRARARCDPLLKVLKWTQCEPLWCHCVLKPKMCHLCVWLSLFSPPALQEMQAFDLTHFGWRRKALISFPSSSPWVNLALLYTPFNLSLPSPSASVLKFLQILWLWAPWGQECIIVTRLGKPFKASKSWCINLGNEMRGVDWCCGKGCCHLISLSESERHTLFFPVQFSKLFEIDFIGWFNLYLHQTCSKILDVFIGFLCLFVHCILCYY